MVRDLSVDREFGAQVARAIENRNLIDFLMALRTSQNLSQGDVANKMDCTQSRVSKLEHGKDDDLRIGDFHAYASALGLEMTIVLCKKDRTIVDELTYHAGSLRRILIRLAELAERDESIAKGSRSVIAQMVSGIATPILSLANTIRTAISIAMLRLPKQQAPAIRMEDGNEDDHPWGREHERPLVGPPHRPSPC
jgi:transcriptional regulator with XRE-family HTH domain